jgi:hypothetical protein
MQSLTLPNDCALILAKFLIAHMGFPGFHAAFDSEAGHECTRSQLNDVRRVLANDRGYLAATRDWNRTGWSNLGRYLESRGTQRVLGRVRTELRFHFMVPTSLAPIKYWSFDRIMT